ncbi:MAG: deoxyribodipyrimidine photo-lyase [Candidatus Magasanikbacteria bacterium]
MKKEQYEKSIWWIKKDIRLKDNIPLISAIEKSNEILPIYIFEPSLISHPQTSNFHLQAQIQALRSLNQKIKQQNSRIIIVKGEIPKIFENLKQKIKFQAIFSYQETGAKITYDRDKRFRRWCKTNKIDWVEKPKNGIIRGDYERGNRMNYWNRRIKNKKPQNKPSKKLIKEKFIAT